MPFLQLDLPARIPAESKRALAQELGALYAAMMETSQTIPAIVVRDGGTGPLRWEDGELREVAVLMCDVRRGREPAQREAAARAFVAAIARRTGLPEPRVVVEFTQHEATEMFRYGAFAPEWSPAESGAGRPA